MHLANFFKQKPILVSIIFAIVMTLLFITCEKDFSPLTGVETTSHDYTWEVDTLHAPDALQVLMRGIWGTDENNVWVVGHSDVAKYQVWHWNGEKWKNQNLLFPGHPFSLNAIYGFAADDIWAVGTDIQNFPNIIHRSFIIHYDGMHWEFVEALDAPMALSVWGSNPSNVFVGCDSGVVLHYNGVNWEKQNTNTLSKIFSIQGFSANQVYASGYSLDLDQTPIDTLFYYFFEYDGNTWNIKDDFIRYPFSPLGKFGHRLWASPEGRLYSVGDDGFFIWQNSSWVKEREEQLFAIHGTSENNIFAGGRVDLLLHFIHFNGISWHEYNEFKVQSGFIIDIWNNKSFVFVLNQEGSKSFIWKGTIND